MNNATQILRASHLRLTGCRREIIDTFLAKKHAICHAEIEQALPLYDRVTLYRTLNTFLEKGIIHKIIDDKGTPKYAICQHCTEQAHYDEHIHFKCIECDLLKCIASVTIPPIHLPEGYQYIDSSFLVRGICKQCQTFKK